MSEWGEVRLGDVTTKIGSGATPRGGKNSYIDSGVALIRSMNVYDFNFVEQDLAYIDEVQADKLNHVSVQLDDVLVNITGASVARTCVAPATHLPARVNQHVAIVRPNPELADAGFINAYLGSPAGKGRLLNLASNGATREALTKQNLEDFTIPYPSIAEQRRIADVIGSIHDLIENNRRRIELLEEMAQAIYREWFVHFRFPGHETATFVDSPLGPIPENWSVKVVGDLAHIDKGLSYKGAFLTDEGVAMANLKCIRAEGGFRRDGTKPYSGTFKSKHQVFPGDIVMANTDLTQAGGVIGASANVPAEGFTGGGIISHHLFAVRPIDQDHRAWLLQVFNDRSFRAFARGVASGTTVLGLRSHDVEQYEVARPSPEIASKFEQMSSDRELLIEQLHHQVELLEAIRERLLPKLVSGEIDVSDLDLDVVFEGAV